MTIEEYIAKEGRHNHSDVVFIGFKVNPSRQWSEITSEDFSCYLRYSLKTEGYERSLLIDETEIAGFLQSIFPDAKVEVDD